MSHLTFFNKRMDGSAFAQRCVKLSFLNSFEFNKSEGVRTIHN